MAVLPFDQRDGFIWMNGELVPWKDAKLHVLSHGLHYASCVFEGERAYGGVVFKSREHSERFKHSAEILDFEIPYSLAELDAAKQLVVDKNGFQGCYVRPVAWRGAAPGSLRARSGRSRSTTKSAPTATPNANHLIERISQGDPFLPALARNVIELARGSP